MSYARGERLPYNASNSVLHDAFKERQTSHTSGKDRAWYLYPFCTKTLLSVSHLNKIKYSEEFF